MVRQARGRFAEKLVLTIAAVTLGVSIIGLAGTILLNAFVFDKYDAYGEVPIPGTATLHLPDLSKGLPKKTAAALLGLLGPRLAAATARERPELVFALATALGRTGHGLPALQELLEPLTTAKPDHVATRAITLLLHALLKQGVAEGIDVSIIGDQVAEAIKADRFWILTHEDMRHLPVERMQRAERQENPA